MHSEIVAPQRRLRLSIAAGIAFVAFCFVVAALEHTIERLTDEGVALRAELTRYKTIRPFSIVAGPRTYTVVNGPFAVDNMTYKDFVGAISVSGSFDNTILITR